MSICRKLLGLTLLASVLTTGVAKSHAQSSVHKPEWWRDAVIYEIYVRSFQDSNGDGVGDLRGVIQRLDYLQNLGVDAIWLTPIFPSPQKDMGYDISDFEAIDPLFGTMADLDELIREAKKRKIKVLLDFVMNHTSDQHPWFKESRSSLSNPKRDWYVWKDGKIAKTPPNNWRDRTEDSAWTFDPTSKQYFYHYFAPQQPDLNWRNPDVQKAMDHVVRFWLQRGVAGFRLDAVNTLFEDASFRNEPASPGTNEYGDPAQSQVYQRNLPEVHDVLRQLRATVDSFPDHPVLVGEVYTADTSEAATWYGKNHDELQLPMNTSVGFLNRLDAKAFGEKLAAVSQMPEENDPLLVFDNHDRPRSIDRYGDGTHDTQIAKVIATILLASRSTSLIYQGQEIGMRTSPVKRREDVRDPRGIAGWPKEKGRDGERTPMQWDSSANAGFTTGTPWLPIPENSATTTVHAQLSDQGSLFNWYRQLIRLRHDERAFSHGPQTIGAGSGTQVLTWLRTGSHGEQWVVVANLSAESTSVNLRERFSMLHHSGLYLKLALDSLEDAPDTRNIEEIRLRPFEVVIGKVL